VGRRAEHVQDSDDGGVGGEHSQAYRRDHCDEDDDGHEVRDHDQGILLSKNLPAASVLDLRQPLVPGRWQTPA